MNKKIAFSLLTTCVIMLAGCELGNDDSASKDEEAVIKEVVKIEEGFKVVGNEQVGYYQIPEEFVEYHDENNPEAFQYSSKGKDFLITASPLDPGVSIDEFLGYIIGDDKNEEVTEIDVNGIKVTQVYQYFEENSYNWYLYILEDKYIILEYLGEQDDLKDKIVKHYSPEPIE